VWPFANAGSVPRYPKRRASDRGNGGILVRKAALGIHTLKASIDSLLADAEHSTLSESLGKLIITIVAIYQINGIVRNDAYTWEETVSGFDVS
jgi:hypothetical protein